MKAVLRAFRSVAMLFCDVNLKAVLRAFCSVALLFARLTRRQFSEHFALLLCCLRG